MHGHNARIYGKHLTLCLCVHFQKTPLKTTRPLYKHRSSPLQPHHIQKTPFTMFSRLCYGVAQNRATFA
ncbi:MAG TPA: hypothetical protein DCE42_22065 [Myxococcales bacterium]|nr:hypothetical protein [Deltaproteobacteria bacterium]HAA57467.1 hypothetical protein [Myxococcales bacterium]